MNIDKAKKFITVVNAIASLSKDRRTKIGAIALGSAGEIRAMGYNGMPRGCNDDIATRHEKPEKYYWFEHAERNLIYNAARVGTPLEGCTLIVSTLFPCMDCARAIIQAGFIKVITANLSTPDHIHSILWTEHKTKSIELFAECGIVIDYI